MPLPVSHEGWDGGPEEGIITWGLARPLTVPKKVRAQCPKEATFPKMRAS